MKKIIKFMMRTIITTITKFMMRTNQHLFNEIQGFKI